MSPALVSAGVGAEDDPELSWREAPLRGNLDVGRRRPSIRAPPLEQLPDPLILRPAPSTRSLSVLRTNSFKVSGAAQCRAPAAGAGDEASVGRHNERHVEPVDEADAVRGDTVGAADADLSHRDRLRRVARGAAGGGEELGVRVGGVGADGGDADADAAGARHHAAGPGLAGGEGEGEEGAVGEVGEGVFVVGVGREEGWEAGVGGDEWPDRVWAHVVEGQVWGCRRWRRRRARWWRLGFFELRGGDGGEGEEEKEEECLEELGLCGHGCWMKVHCAMED